MTGKDEVFGKTIAKNVYRGVTYLVVNTAKGIMIIIKWGLTPIKLFIGKRGARNVARRIIDERIKERYE